MIGVQLKSLRKDQSLTQRELAERLGCRQSQIAGIERGSLNPGVKMLLRYQEYFGVTLIAFHNQRNGLLKAERARLIAEIERSKERIAQIDLELNPADVFREEQ